MTGPPSPTYNTGNLLTCQDLAVAVKNGYLYTEGNTFLGKGGCSAPGCDKAMELDKDSVIAKECPYLLGFKSRTVSNTLYFVGTLPDYVNVTLVLNHGKIVLTE